MTDLVLRNIQNSSTLTNVFDDDASINADKCGKLKNTSDNGNVMFYVRLLYHWASGRVFDEDLFTAA